MRFCKLLPILTTFIIGSTTTITLVQGEKRLRGAMIASRFNLKNHNDIGDEVDKDANIRRILMHIITGREAPRAGTSSLKSLIESGSISNIDTTLAEVKQKLATSKRISPKVTTGPDSSASSAVAAETTTTATTVATTVANDVSPTAAPTNTTTSVETTAESATTTTDIGPHPKGSADVAAFDSIQFYHLAPVKAVSPSYGDTTFTKIGSVFLYHGPLYDAVGEEIPGARVAGECTKTQVRDTLDHNTTALAGGGLCHFTYILETAADGSPKVSMNAVGHVYDIVGGGLAITGGTDKLVGASGEVSIKPFYNSTTEFDFFTHAVVYEVNATIY